ncbi:uncharacterized protein EI97DRAFT_437048 [Westerdykella ornata]|uniref:Integral membrane protein-like protein n=1 Tax=Westerdykella ornata TaxID=318751 RepID=A0A6A6J804_WESOR|nr:uncharacterized protein EI97DRAFT_437048 [Westerdykella ornata]KAF2272293.1 hypothetical protein EI97DRAFT_437048 [Westerdykella ornata]
MKTARLGRAPGMGGIGITLAVAVVGFAAAARAHEHHGEGIPEGKFISDDPIDSILWTHILIQIVAWGILFPTGMVLGIIRSRWHVPVQTTGAVLAILAYFLGHAHKGRQFAPNMHAKFASAMMLVLLSQVGLGIYLKLHLERGFNGRIRPYIVKAHGIVGKIMPVLIWTQFVFGGFAALGFCFGDHTGQCLAHFIMGGAFIAYGVILTILLLVGQLWLRRTGRSQEFFDSLVIAAWGCVNTFTEHRWGGEWVGNDLQHTSMGVIWWCAGLVGIWLSRRRDGSPKRNLIPALVIILTGFGMSAHPQHLELSNHVHTMFGYTLMAAGFTRIIEISILLRDKGATTRDGSDPNSFQYLPPFLLYASGFLFMGATEEQMKLLSDAHVTHVSYILLLYSIAFVLFLFVNMLVHLYAVHAFPLGPVHKDADAAGVEANGGLAGNGHLRGDRRVRDAEEFELEGLISEDERAEDEDEDEEGKVRRNGAARA